MNPYMRAASPVPVSPIVGHPGSPYAAPPTTYGQAAPYQQTTPYPRTSSQQAADIQPGSITYTTTVGADGQVVYHPFKAVPASYQTAQGIVSGIQWIPAEATSVLPAGATPADSNFAASFSRRPEDRTWRDDDYSRRRDDEHRRSPKYDRDGRRYDDDDDYYRRDRDRDDDREYRDRRPRDRDDRDRERDRDRRMSGYGGRPGDYDKYANDKYATADLERRMENMDLDRRERDRQRERDREFDREQDRVRSRRGSFYGGGERPTSTYQTAPGGNYPSTYNQTASNTYAAAPGGNYPVGVAGSGSYRAPSPRPLDRPGSPYRNPGAVPRPTSIYDPGAAPIAPRPVSPYQAGAIPRAASPFQHGGIQRAASPYGAPPPPIARAGSPYGGAVPLRSASPYHGASAGTIYPPGHVLEGQPLRGASPYAAPVNLYANPNTPYAAGVGQAPYATPASTYGSGIGSGPLDAAAAAAQGGQMLPAPEGFSRPPNRAQAYTQFEMLKIGDMEDLLDTMPRMPAVLIPHDVYHDDWIRLMTDLGLSWSGTLPVPQYSPDGRPPKRSTLAADVVDLWNSSFFRMRGVEMILYKGRERRSGRYAGTVDMHLPGFDKFDVSSPSEDDDDDDDEDRHRDRDRYGGGYGRAEEDRRRREAKADRRRRKLEKKIRKRQKEMERSYAIYLQCVPPSEM